MVLELLARAKEHGWSECVAVFGVFTHPHMFQESHRTKKHMHRHKYTVVPDFRVACILPSLLTVSYGTYASTNESYATLSQLIVSRM